jgi:hypothetical protein
MGWDKIKRGASSQSWNFLLRTRKERKNISTHARTHATDSGSDSHAHPTLPSRPAKSLLVKNEAKKKKKKIRPPAQTHYTMRRLMLFRPLRALCQKKGSFLKPCCLYVVCRVVSREGREGGREKRRRLEAHERLLFLESRTWDSLFSLSIPTGGALTCVVLSTICVPCTYRCILFPRH